MITNLKNISFGRLIKQVLIMLCLFAFSAEAQILRLDTIGCNVNETDTSYLNKMVRHEGQFYNKIFNNCKNDTTTIKMSLYGDNKAYIKATRLNKLKAFSNGLYSSSLNKTFIYKSESFMHVILRAASNNLWHYNYPDAPQWLTEGSATLMSFIDENGDRKITYTPMFDYNKQIKDLTWGDGVDFDSLFMPDNPDWDSKTNGKVLHAVSFCVIYFLVIQEKDYLTPIVTSMMQGHTATEAIASSFGSFEDFKNKFIVYYRYVAPSRLSKASM